MSWYSKWFGSDYISLYSHRDVAEAKAQVGFLLSRLSVARSLKVLDIACGFGRHSAELEACGHWAVGIDLSAELLTYSRSQSPSLNLVRGDMRRLPFKSESFDLVCSFFTSFGYFDSDEEHQALLSGWQAMLRPDGRLFIDYLNKPQVIASLAADTQSEDAERTYVQQRWIDPGQTRVFKRIMVTDKASGDSTEYLESVRMYSRAELCGMLGQAGLEPEEEFGDFAGAPPSPTSPRLLVLARRVDGAAAVDGRRS